MAHINWVTRANKETEFFEVQRSTTGRDFETVGRVMVIPPNAEQEYNFDDNVYSLTGSSVYYRLKVKMQVGISYSSIIKLNLTQNENDVTVFPNPVKDVLQLAVPSSKREEATLSIYDVSGALLRTTKAGLTEGINVLQVDASFWKAGTYMVNITTDSRNVWKKFIVSPAGFNK
jgi:hypothetical protein